MPAFLAISLPLDVVSDGLGWGHEWQWGYFKHPPLPSWEVEVFFDALGDIGPFFLSQISIGVTYFFVFLLGRRMMPADRALAGTILLVGVYYFSIPTPEFNHNVALMPLWAAAAYFYYAALQTGAVRAWLLLGIVVGIGMLSKYEMAVLAAVMALHAISSPRKQPILTSGGPYYALLACLAVTLPNLIWLVHHDFSTLHYAEMRSGHGDVLHWLLVPPHFLLSQMLALAPCLIIAAFVGILRRDTFRNRVNLHDENLRFLVLLGVGPALFCAVLSLVTGMGLRDMWGAPMWNLTGLILVRLASDFWDRVSFSRLLYCTAALFVLLPVSYALSTKYVTVWHGRPSRTQWPDRALAERFSRLWHSKMAQPLEIVAGDAWLAGLIALRETPRPSVFTDGNYSEAPWITPQRLKRAGALVVWQDSQKPEPPPQLRLPGLVVQDVQVFAWPDAPSAKPLRVYWGIVPPYSIQKHAGR